MLTNKHCLAILSFIMLLGDSCTCMQRPSGGAQMSVSRESDGHWISFKNYSLTQPAGT